MHTTQLVIFPCNLFQSWQPLNCIRKAEKTEVNLWKILRKMLLTLGSYTARVQKAENKFKYYTFKY